VYSDSPLGWPWDHFSRRYFRSSVSSATKTSISGHPLCWVDPTSSYPLKTPSLLPKLLHDSIRLTFYFQDGTSLPHPQTSMPECLDPSAPSITSCWPTASSETPPFLILGKMSANLHRIIKPSPVPSHQSTSLPQPSTAKEYLTHYLSSDLTQKPHLSEIWTAFQKSSTFWSYPETLYPSTTLCSKSPHQTTLPPTASSSFEFTSPCLLWTNTDTSKQNGAFYKLITCRLL
jgi:hypothetical protein